MKITQLIANWYPTPESGDYYDSYEVGKKGVIRITEHRPAGEGDKWFYDVDFEGQSTKRIFNPNSVSIAGE